MDYKAGDRVRMQGEVIELGITHTKVNWGNGWESWVLSERLEPIQEAKVEKYARPCFSGGEITRCDHDEQSMSCKVCISPKLPWAICPCGKGSNSYKDYIKPEPNLIAAEMKNKIEVLENINRNWQIGSDTLGREIEKLKGSLDRSREERDRYSREFDCLKQQFDCSRRANETRIKELIDVINTIKRAVNGPGF